MTTKDIEMVVTSLDKLLVNIIQMSGIDCRWFIFLKVPGDSNAWPGLRVTGLNYLWWFYSAGWGVG